MEEHEKRQHLRRMIDPGIVRPNSKQVAVDSLKASVLVLGPIQSLFELNLTRNQTTPHRPCP